MDDNNELFKLQFYKTRVHVLNNELMNFNGPLSHWVRRAEESYLGGTTSIEHKYTRLLHACKGPKYAHMCPTKMPLNDTSGLVNLKKDLS